MHEKSNFNYDFLIKYLTYLSISVRNKDINKSENVTNNKEPASLVLYHDAPTTFNIFEIDLPEGVRYLTYEK